MTELIKSSKELVMKTIWLNNYYKKNLLTKSNNYYQEFTDLDNIISKNKNISDHIFKLDANLKNNLEIIFDADFSDVKIHTGPHADKLAKSNNADAVTIDNDIYFRDGMYKPDMEHGLSLLSHELIHVVQFQKNKRMIFPEDIENLEHHASKIEEQMTVLKLYNINIPLLSDNPQNYSVDSNNQEFQNYSIDEAAETQIFNKNESLDNFRKKENKTLIKYKSSKGKTYIFTQNEYKEIKEKTLSKLTDFIQEKKYLSTEQEYDNFLLKFINYIKR